VIIQRLLDVPTPAYRHHLLLLASYGDKLAKLHGSIPSSRLRARYRADELVGVLAAGVGLTPTAEPTTPDRLVPHFAWSRVTSQDRIATWTDQLVISPLPPS